MSTSTEIDRVIKGFYCTCIKLPLWSPKTGGLSWQEEKNIIFADLTMEIIKFIRFWWAFTVLIIQVPLL